MYLVPSPSLCFLIAFGFTRDFCEAMRLWGQKSSSVLVFNTKGEKLRPKQLDQLPFVYFFLKFIDSYCKKPLSCGGEIRLREKGEFLVLDQI
jgi:hypothetical protein